MHVLIAILLVAATAGPRQVDGHPAAEPGLGREQAARLARKAIRDRAQMIPLRAGVDSLVLIGIHSGDHWRIDFEQTYRGVIVDGPAVGGINEGRHLGLSVHFSKDGEFAGMEDHYYRGLACDTEPLVAEEEATRIATESTPEEWPWTAMWTRLRVLPPSPGRLVWEVQVGHARVDVDALDGRVLSRRVTIPCLGGR